MWRDLGLTAIAFRLMAKLLDYNFLAVMTAGTAHTMKDYQELDAIDQGGEEEEEEDEDEDEEDEEEE